MLCERSSVQARVAVTETIPAVVKTSRGPGSVDRPDVEFLTLVSGEVTVRGINCIWGTDPRIEDFSSQTVRFVGHPIAI